MTYHLTSLILCFTSLWAALQRPPGAHDPVRQQGGHGAEAHRLVRRRPRDGAAPRRALHGDVGQGPPAEHRRRLQGGRATHTPRPGRGRAGRRQEQAMLNHVKNLRENHESPRVSFREQVETGTSGMMKITQAWGIHP